jgi:hypothetical protein
VRIAIALLGLTGCQLLCSVDPIDAPIDQGLIAHYPMENADNGFVTDLLYSRSSRCLE